MRVLDLVPSFLLGLRKLGIVQSQVATRLKCSESLISRIGSGERSLPLADFVGLLLRLCREYPELRAELVEAALGELLEELGCELVVKPVPPPAAPSNLVVLADYRTSRALPVRRAA